MRQVLARFLRDETGATSIEYSVIAVGIAVVLVAAVTNLGSTVKASTAPAVLPLLFDSWTTLFVVVPSFTVTPSAEKTEHSAQTTDNPRLEDEFIGREVLLLLAPAEISFLRVNSVDARSYEGGRTTSRFLSGFGCEGALSCRGRGALISTRIQPGGECTDGEQRF